MSVQDFLDFMTSTITVNPFLSVSVAGVITYDVANARTYQCRISMRNHMIVNAQGREVVARGVIYVGSTVMIDLRDQLVMPSPFQPTNPVLLDVVPVYDETGLHHIKLELG